MSYFQRLVAQSRSAATSRPVVDGVRPPAGGADIDEIHVESDASSRRPADTSPSAPADRATMAATSGGRARVASPASDAEPGSARSGDSSSGLPVDRSGPAERDDAPDRPASAAASGIAPPRPGDMARTLASIDPIASAPHERRDHGDRIRERVIDDRAGDSPRPSGATPSPRAPAQPHDDPAGSAASILDASTPPASGMAASSVPDSRHESDRLQAIVAGSPEAAAVAAGQRVDAPAPTASATRAQAGRTASDPALQSGGPRVEVRFGRVSVEVHAMPPAPIAAPVVQIVAPAAAPAFVPSRHYLRMD